MPTISNEQEFKQAIASLTPAELRAVGALFLQNLVDITDEPRLRKVIDVAQDKNATPKELEDAYHIARSIAIETFTVVGRELDPERQALHFLATASSYCLMPEDVMPPFCKKRAPFAVALHTRMARCWSQIAQGEEDQYRILGGFFAARE